MKKTLTLLALCLSGLTSLNAQSYSYIETEGTASSFDPLYTNADTVLYNPANEKLSSWQELPFSFTFYGKTVTGYYASDNGYITFDSLATTSSASNTSLPNTSGPNNAIYVLWDDLDVANNSSGTKDRVISWTYGTTPNRVHVVEWMSVTKKGLTSADYIYAAIRLYESSSSLDCYGEDSRFDVVLNGANVLGFTATVGCEDATGTDGTDVTGSPSWDYPTYLDYSSNSDDVVYTFFTPKQNDLSILETNLEEYVIEGSDVLTGTVYNAGTDVVTSFDASYTVNGGTAQPASFTGLSIAPGSSYTFTHPTNLSLTGGSNYELVIWIENVNSTVDERNCNDTLSVEPLCGTGVSANKFVLVEEFTTAVCGWCASGSEYMEDVLETYPNAIGVGLHAGFYTDDMTISGHSTIASAFTGAAPTACVDRIYYEGESYTAISRGDWADRTAERLNERAFCDIGISYTVNTTASTFDATVDLSFVDYVKSGDVRVNLYLVEDSVTGSGSGYDQVNYSDTDPNSKYYGAGDPIVGFVHRNVVRDFVAGTWGTSGLVSSSTNPGDEVTKSYTNNSIDTDWDKDQLYLVAFVAYYSSDETKNEVVNAFKIKMDGTSGSGTSGVGNTVSLNNASSISVYPSPMKEMGFVQLNLNSTEKVKAALYDMLGHKVKDIQESTYTAGSHYVAFTATDLTNGIYFVNVTIGNTTYSEKVVVAK